MAMSKMIDKDILIEEIKDKLYPERFGENCNALDIIDAFMQLVNKQSQTDSFSIPCEIGTKVYDIGTGNIEEFNVIGFKVGQTVTESLLDQSDGNNTAEWYMECKGNGEPEAFSGPVSEIGQSVFFTPEEALKALNQWKYHKCETVYRDSLHPLSDGDMSGYGYLCHDIMTAYGKEAALTLFDEGVPIYLLFPDNTEVLAEEREMIESHPGIFGVEKETHMKKGYFITQVLKHRADLENEDENTELDL